MSRAQLYFKFLLLCLAWLSWTHFSFSQNLVPNPSFEEYTECPFEIQNGWLECPPWQNGNQATCNYYNVCAAGTDVGIPDNWVGSQEAHTGQAYAGSIYKWFTPPWQEYLQVQLTEPCAAGYSYDISFYVSLADFFCGIQHIGVYFSSAPPDSLTQDALSVDPQFESQIGYISDSENWVLISGCFPAQGGEQWITIGNFHNFSNTELDPNCNTSVASYYYIDDVSLIQGESYDVLDLDLGEDIFTCESYEIDPGVSAVEYNWSDGSHDPTLIVTETGTYTLTISIGCTSFGIDSVEVTFLGTQAEVDLGPQEVTICEGDSYMISLDPGMGDYEWQDGSNDPDYTITTTGVYSVSMDDGCDITTDEITVFVMEGPEPFSLGDDANLCQGDEIEFSFDPDLGDFAWQDGSISSDYTIDIEGNYSLTISNACGSYSDDIVVSDLLPPEIDLGPDVINICEGQTFDISLDPDLGDYVWQDGSTSSSYSITMEGTYAVTVTNQCGTESDDVTAFIIDVPAPFTLGDDTQFCTGDEIVFSFDLALGDFQWQDNSTFPDYTVETGGLYSLTISNMCGEVTDEIEVTEIIQPEVDLGEGQVTICEGQVIDIILDPDMGDYLWQDGSTSSSYTIANGGIYSVTVTNECGSSSDVLGATILNEPVFDFGPDIVLCPAQLPITLDAGVALYVSSFLWQDNSTGTQLVVTGPGIYAVTLSNACFSIVDEIEVFVQDASPPVVLPSDQSLCEGETFLLNAGSLVGNYTWQDSSTLSTFLVHHEGTYSLTVSNQCGSGSDSISVIYTDTLSEFSLGPDVSLCPGEQYIFYAGIPGASYTWQDMSTADSLVVTLPGTYSLQISNMCDTIADTVMVVGNNNPPLVNLPSSIDLCAGEVITIDAGIAGVQYLWNDGTQLSSIDVSAPGLYSLTVSNSCGADADTIVVLDAGPPPSVSLNEDLKICPGQEIIVSPNSSGVTSWLWQDGSTGSIYNVSSPGIVSVEVNNNCGSDSDTMIVSLLPATPALDLGPDTSLCPGEIITFSITTPDVNILWPDGSSDSDYSVASAGSILATISNQCGAASDSLDVILLPPAPILNLGNDQSLCPGETIDLAPGISGVDYLWQDGSTSSFYNATQPGLIILSVSNDCGSSVDTIEIIVDTDGPELDLGDDVLACAGEIVTLNAGISGVDYLWQDGSTEPYYSTDVSGTYTLLVSNACGEDADTVIVDFSGKAPTPALGPDTMFCEGFAFQLHSDADDDTNITWQDGSTLPVFNVSSSGIYTLSESNFCGARTDTIVITTLAAPHSFDLGPDTVLCPGESVILYAPSTDDLITWQDGTHGVSIIADQEKTYSLQLSNMCGTAEDELRIRFDDKIPVINIDPSISMCPDEIITLDATQEFIASYLWNTGSTLPLIQVNAPGVYAIKVTAPCQSIQQDIEVISGEGCHHDIYIPNVFSPNGDDVNDLFTISFSSNLNVVSVSCSIFDRWGNNVFHSDEMNFEWDGRFRNKLLQPGVYVYQINVDYMVSGELQNKVFVGDITLLR